MKNFTIKNIKDFMLEHCGWKWFYDILDQETGNYRLAINKDFERITTNQIQVFEVDKTISDCMREILIVVSNDTFKIYGIGDYSKSWQDYLDKQIDRTKSL